MDVRPLVPTDAAKLQSLRLRGLLECPTAFASSYEEECDYATSLVEERLRPCNGRATFGAFEGHDIVGMVGISREEHRKLAHKAYLWGMYVTPDARRYGVGRQLVAEALSFARSDLGVSQVLLGVNVANQPAIGLYERSGFTAYGREPRFMLVDGVPHDELQMVCFLQAEIRA